MPRKRQPAEGQEPSRVGYKRPPAHTRFQKGQSGNPSGKAKRPKPAGAASEREAVMAQPLTMTRDGTRVTVTARQALYQKLLAMGLEGNLRAMTLLLKLDAQNENQATQPTPEEAGVSGNEEAVIARFLQRHAQDGGGEHE